MMTIADIYDALTAGDRPYKAAVPVEAALDILAAERRAGRIDGALFDLFLGAKVYERTHVPPPNPREGDRRRPSQ
jgi:3',5'-cyclic-nucleotide phosphodiesterase